VPGCAGDRGRVVVVGAVGMTSRREPSYRKELELRLSRSYGPGRYDPTYEEKGQDYPIGYRALDRKAQHGGRSWTSSQGAFRWCRRFTHRFKFDQAKRPTLYFPAVREGGPAPLGILFEYDTSRDHLSPVAWKVATTSGSQVLCVPVVRRGWALLVPGISPPHPHSPAGGKQPRAAGRRRHGHRHQREHTAQKFGFVYSTCDYHQC